VEESEEALRRIAMKATDALKDCDSDDDKKEEEEMNRQKEGQKKPARTPEEIAELQLLSKLQGVSRVAEVAKGLLLSGDRAAALVVGCSQPPTLKLLHAVATALREEFASREKPVSAFQVYEFEEEAGVCVSFAPKVDEDNSISGGDGSAGAAITPYAVNISMTCAKLRETKEGDNDLEGLDGPDDRFLPLIKCQHALAEMRRAKWWMSSASGLPSCVETARIFRDLRRRKSEWRPLSGWALELLCESVLRSALSPTVLQPGRAIRRVLEVRRHTSF